jgi:hypothetical protein
MIGLKFTIESNLVTARAHGQIMRELNRGILEQWQWRYLAKHFEGGATARYGYRKRSARYTAWKGRRYGHTIPLVLTGGTRDAVRSGVKITATQHRATLKTRGRRFSSGKLGGLTAEMRGEIEKITPAEQQALKAWAQKEYIRLVRKPEYKRRRVRNV